MHDIGVSVHGLVASLATAGDMGASLGRIAGAATSGVLGGTELNRSPEGLHDARHGVVGGAVRHLGRCTDPTTRLTECKRVEGAVCGRAGAIAPFRLWNRA